MSIFNVNHFKHIMSINTVRMMMPLAGRLPDYQQNAMYDEKKLNRNKILKRPYTISCYHFTNFSKI